MVGDPGEEELSVDDVLDQPMLALNAPESRASFWQLGEERGRSLLDPDATPVTTVSATHLALMTSSAVVTVSESTTRLAHTPYVHAIKLSDASPSAAAVATRRADDRREVRQFVEAAVATTAAHIDLLPGGRIPDPR